MRAKNRVLYCALVVAVVVCAWLLAAPAVACSIPVYRYALEYWRAISLMPDNSDVTAKMLWVAGSWLKKKDAKAAEGRCFRHQLLQI